LKPIDAHTEMTFKKANIYASIESNAEAGSPQPAEAEGFGRIKRN
jgi:hypothetical protein